KTRRILPIPGGTPSGQRVHRSPFGSKDAKKNLVGGMANTVGPEAVTGISQGLYQSCLLL
ncbi:unnamed protein product, partial [Allacma fusca]